MTTKILATKKTFFQVNIQEIRGKKKACEICGKDFSVLVKEHQCKRCKRAVCYACSQTKAPVYKINLFKTTSDAPHRQCLKCKAESERQRQFIAENKLIFGRDTLSARWLQQLNNKLKYSEITKEYFDNLNDPQFELKFNKEGTSEQLTYKKYKEADQQLEKILQEYCEAFNYSLQEFFHFVINKTDPQSICISIRNIMKAFLNKHPEYGFDNQFILIITFFLCFSSEPVAYTIISNYYDQVYPRQLYYKFIKQNNYDIQKYMQLIGQLLENVFQVPPTTAQKTQSYLKHDFLRLAFSLSINALTFENTFLLIDNSIASCSFMEFLKGVTAICQLKMEEIMKYADVSFEKLQVIILRNVEHQDLKDALQLFELVDAKVQEKVIQFFQKEEEKEGFVLDDKYFQNKIIQSDQYKELQFKFEQQNDEKEVIVKQMEMKDQSYAQLLQDNERIQQEFSELKEQFILQQQELFTFRNMPKQEIIKQQSSQSQDQKIEKKQESFQEARIKQLEVQTTLMQTQLDEFEKIKQEQVKTIKRLQDQLRESNKMLTDTNFELAEAQFELDAVNGKSRQRSSTRQQETIIKLSYEVLGEKLAEITKQYEKLLIELDNSVIEQSEQRMNFIRDRRALQEQQHIQNTLQLQVDLLQEQLRNEIQAHLEDQQQNQQQIQQQYKSMFESLEVAYNRNDQLQNENLVIITKDKQIREKLSEMNKVVKVLQEDNEKLRLENEELNQINQLAKKADSDNISSQYNQLLQIEDVDKQKLAKSLLDKVNDLIKEIQFRTIDQLLKREYIKQLQIKNKSLSQNLEDQEKALKILGEKIENYQEHEEHPQKQQLQQSLNDYSVKARNISIPVQKEDCNIM